MAITFIMAGLSAMMFWGQGFSTWVWQIIAMLWVISNLEKQMRIESMERKINETIKKLENGQSNDRI